MWFMNKKSQINSECPRKVELNCPGMARLAVEEDLEYMACLPSEASEMSTLVSNPMPH
jgi:hypothetical protein